MDYDRIISAPDAGQAPAPTVDWNKPLRVIHNGAEFPAVYVGIDYAGDNVVAWINGSKLGITGYFDDGGAEVFDTDYRVVNDPE